jgi:large subunit ribosomal protein L21
MSYAIVEIGGAQHRVSPGDRIRVQRLHAAGKTEGEVTLEKVLLVQGDGGIKLGAPYVEGAAVTARVLGEMKGPKVLVFKKKKRKGYRRTRGHRQAYTSLLIGEIRPGD